jgi:hypothetical protein
VSALVSIDSNVNSLIVHLDKLPDELKRQLEVKITQLTTQLLGQVKAREPVQTGRLRAATRSFVDIRRGFIRGRVRILPTGKASRLGAAFGALEYGGPGQRRAGKKVEVEGYRRRSGPVAAYKRRQPHIRARRFLRGPGAAMRPRARVELEAIIGETLHEFTKF